MTETAEQKRRRRPYTAKDDARLRALRDDAGLGWDEIARVMARTPASVATHYGVLRKKELEKAADEAAARDARKAAEKRPCLKCRRKFKSAGAHNRLCKSCRNQNERAPSPIEPFRVAI